MQIKIFLHMHSEISFFHWVFDFEHFLHLSHRYCYFVGYGVECFSKISVHRIHWCSFWIFLVINPRYTRRLVTNNLICWNQCWGAIRRGTCYELRYYFLLKSIFHYSTQLWCQTKRLIVVPLILLSFFLWIRAIFIIFRSLNISPLSRAFLNIGCYWILLCPFRMKENGFV